MCPIDESAIGKALATTNSGLKRVNVEGGNSKGKFLKTFLRQFISGCMDELFVISKGGGQQMAAFFFRYVERGL